MAYYLDSSALVKLVIDEPESVALHAWMAASERTAISNDLARTEVLRAVRLSEPALAGGVRSVLDSIELIDIPASAFDAAGRLSPPGLRSLDALHLASALGLGDELEGLVTYDARLAEAARANGVSVLAPI